MELTTIIRRPVKSQRPNYYCSDCNSWFTEKRALIRHEKTQQHLRKLGLKTDFGFPCTICGQKFTRKFDLRRHEQRRHAGTPTRKSSDKSSAYTTPSSVSEEMEQTTSNRGDLSYYDTRLDCLRLVDQSSISHRNESFSTSGGDIGIDLNESLSWESLTGTTLVDSTSFQAKDSSRFQRFLAHTKLAAETARGIPRWSRKSIIPTNGRVKSIPARRVFFCNICSEAFEEENTTELHAHMRTHRDEFFGSNGSHRCGICEIDFTHKADLKWHLLCAADGHCGFHFSRFEQCTGHHPPDDSYRNTFRYHLRVRHWEQAQLRAFNSSFRDLESACGTIEGDACSVETPYRAPRRASRATVDSVPISLKTFASAPCDVDLGMHIDVRGLCGRLRRMTVRLRKSARTVFRLANCQDGGLNTKMLDAARRGDSAKVIEFLHLGADPNFRSSAGETMLDIAEENNYQGIAEIYWHFQAMEVASRMDVE